MRVGTTCRVWGLETEGMIDGDTIGSAVDALQILVSHLIMLVAVSTGKAHY